MSQLVVLAWLSTIVTTALIFIDPWGLQTESSPPASIGTALAIACQAFAVPAFGVAIAFLVESRSHRLGQLLSVSFSLLLPLLVALDSMTWRWIGQHLISRTMWQVSTEKRASLFEHLTINIVLGLGLVLLVAAIVAVVMLYLSRAIGRTWEAWRRMPRPKSIYLAGIPLLILASLHSWYKRADIRVSLSESPFLHPICVLGILRPASSVVVDLGPRIDLSVNGYASRVMARQAAQRLVTSTLEPSTEFLPDVLVVVIESFRRELITSDVMPGLASFADHSIHCRSHFSGGNATNHGIFSLVNGLEAIWHETPVRFSPLMNRLLRQVGYELGFFGGHNDWRKFHMDGYISSEQFDRFEIDAPGGLKSDRQSIQSAAKFLERKNVDESSRRPRLAMLYLYATHAPYESYVDDQVFQPAADNRFTIPYAASQRDLVWNRYQNSARTVDQMLKSLLQDDRVVIVTGDHGESFLDDGSIGHGIRLSEFQNMTPAIFYAPGVSPRKIDMPTMHADLLPTLLAAVGLTISHETVFDGDNLLAVSDDQLHDRTFVTRNYLQNDIALIGPWTSRAADLFAFRVSVSLHPFHARPLAAINASGRDLETSSAAALAQWLESRFGEVNSAAHHSEFKMPDKSVSTGP